MQAFSFIDAVLLSINTLENQKNLISITLIIPICSQKMRLETSKYMVFCAFCTIFTFSLVIITNYGYYYHDTIIS